MPRSDAQIQIQIRVAADSQYMVATSGLGARPYKTAKTDSAAAATPVSPFLIVSSATFLLSSTDSRAAHRNPAGMCIAFPTAK